jgi:hypothetical protein
MRLSAKSTVRMQPCVVTKKYLRGEFRRARTPSARWWRFLLLAALLISLGSLGNGETVHDGDRISRLSTQDQPEVAKELVDVVEAFIVAGEKDDPAVRGKYLAPKVFFYGHAGTHEQALKQIASLYRRWPQRKFALTDLVDLFEIPHHRGVYRVTAVYEYKFDNLDEHLSGKSKITCVVEHDLKGTRIIGVDEKLENASTEYRKD